MTKALSARTPIIPVILSGGMGSRLWPMSRSKYPKQFLSLAGNPHASLLQQTALRVKDQANVKDPIIVSNEEHRFLVAEHMQRAGFDNSAIILEPMMRNTAPAITAAALYIQSQFKNALMLVLPSDHVINDEKAFAKGVKKAADAARQGKLVTFGIEPEYPETGYGYIKQGKMLNGPLDGKGIFDVNKFVEKPDEKTAKRYLKAGEYSWNSGMFMFPVDAFLSEIESHNPDVMKHVSAALENGQQETDFVRLNEADFAKSPNISVDYAVMENTKNAAVVPMACGWSDAGAWDSLWRIGEKDKDGNVVKGQTYTYDVEDSYLHVQGGAPIAALGVDDLVVVSTKDMVLVTKKDRAQDVKKLMETVKEENTELVEQHQRVFRPWGFYETLELDDRHQVKHIHVKPGAKLSVQMHHHRAEHWVVTGGTARVQCDDEELILTENQYVYIPLASIHAIENIGKIGLDFIEVQHGAYLGEDDIVRFTDMYGRAGTTG
jgi:mannose-1-phosphate guanylyltransferase/mannose-6-phosphate isomerase